MYLLHHRVMERLKEILLSINTDRRFLILPVLMMMSVSSHGSVASLLLFSCCFVLFLLFLVSEGGRSPWICL